MSTYCLTYDVASGNQERAKEDLLEAGFSDSMKGTPFPESAVAIDTDAGFDRVKSMVKGLLRPHDPSRWLLVRSLRMSWTD